MWPTLLAHRLYLLADSIRGPALFVIQHEKLAAIVNDDEVAVYFMWRIREVRREIEKAGAVGVHCIRSGECPLHGQAIEPSSLVAGELTPAIEHDVRHRGEELAGHLAPLELDSVCTMQGTVRTALRSR